MQDNTELCCEWKKTYQKHHDELLEAFQRNDQEDWNKLRDQVEKEAEIEILAVDLIASVDYADFANAHSETLPFEGLVSAGTLTAMAKRLSKHIPPLSVIL